MLNLPSSPGSSTQGDSSFNSSYSSSSSSDQPVRPSFFPGGPAQPSRGGSGDSILPKIRNQHGALAKYLSKSGSGERGAGKSNKNLLNKHPLVSPQNSSRFGAPKSPGPGSRNELPSFLQKYANLSRESRSSVMFGAKSSTPPAAPRRSSQTAIAGLEEKIAGHRVRSLTDPMGHRSKFPSVFQKKIMSPAPSELVMWL